MNADFTAGSGEPRNHNKKRRQDEDPPDTGDFPPTDAPIRSSQPSAYKETLLEDRTRVNPNDEDFLDEEDIDLNDGDVKRGMENGLITIDFSDRVHALAVKNMGFSGPEFTWSRGMAQVRLDRVLCNSYWDETYPESTVHHLFQMKSDHRPIMISVGDSDHVNRSKHFRYFSGWLSHDDFPHIVQDNWQASENIVDTFKNFAKATAVWNDTVFGYIGTKKRILMAQLRGIQKALCTRRNHFLVSFENSLLIELETVIEQEEFLWRQKSRSEWITHGDRNTRYFHLRATCRKQKIESGPLSLTQMIGYLMNHP
ncbi:hypothetical protein GQ457_09G013220 [Hibiscus cannabinus]